MNTNIWYEKYRPKCLDDITIPDHTKEELKEWFKKFQQGDNTQCALLFMGPPGLGKTSLAHIILKEFGYSVKEFNASDIRSKSLIMENLDGLINMASVHTVGRPNVKVGIIMDEVDGMFKGDRGGMDALLSFIAIPSKRTKAKDVVNHNRKVPVICISNIAGVKKDKINSLKKECFTIEFTVPSDQDMITVLDKIATNEKMEISADAKDRIVSYSQADFRKLISLMEFIHTCYLGLPIGVEEVEHCLLVMTPKAQDLYVTDAVKKFMNDKLDAHEIQSIYNSDKSKTPMVIHQNYLSAVSAQKEPISTKLQTAIHIINSLIISDEIEKMMYSNQNWGLQHAQSLTCAHIPSYYINRKPKQYPIEPKWAGILSVNSQAQNLWKNVHLELEAMSTSNKIYSIGDLQHIIELIFHHLINGNVEQSMALVSRYKLCHELHEHSKKALTVLDKLGKYIKSSPYYGLWAKFMTKNKSNHELDAEIYLMYSKYEKTIEAVVTRGDIAKTRPKPKQVVVAPRLIKPPAQTSASLPVKAPDDTMAKTADQQAEAVKKRKVTVIIKAKS